jgi:hypothetical protein
MGMGPILPQKLSALKRSGASFATMITERSGVGNFPRKWGVGRSEGNGESGNEESSATARVIGVIKKRESRREASGVVSLTQAQKNYYN